jgi:hypothetical protein
MLLSPLRSALASAVRSPLDAGRRVLASLPAPLLLESFDSLSGFSVLNNSSASISTANKVQGSGALEIVGTGFSSAANATKTGLLSDTQFSDLGVVAYHYDTITTDPDEQHLASVDCRLGRAGTYYTQVGVTAPTSGSSASFVHTGGYWHAFHVSEVPALPTGAGDVSVRMQCTQVSPFVARARIDSLLSNAKGRPTVLITFDDIRPGQYTEAFSYMQARGLRGSFYVPTSLVGGTNRLTLAQLQEMDAAGWDMALDGTNDDTAMTTRASPDACVTELQSMQEWLSTNGLSQRAKDHICYPNGTYQVAGASVSLSNVSLSSGSAVVGVSSTGGITAGMKAVCFAIPSGTRVQSVDSGTQLTLTAAATETSTSRTMRIVDDSGGFHTGKLPAALKAAGFKTARTTTAGGDAMPFYSRYGIADRGLLLPGQGVTGMTLAQMTAFVDKARLRGSTCLFYLHDVTEAGGSINISTANFRGLIDYIQAAGDVDVLTLSQWWARDCANPGTPPSS